MIERSRDVIQKLYIGIIYCKYIVENSSKNQKYDVAVLHALTCIVFV